MSLHGPRVLGEHATHFRVWAPRASIVTLVCDDGRREHLAAVGDGYHAATLEGAGPGTRYRYLLDDQGPFADPASRSQPDGVHGASEVVATRAPSPASWRGVPLAAQVICELHVGTFSPAGTFAGVAEGLDDLARAGYSVIELMPVAEFSGPRNWGYDGVFPFAVQSSYGGPDGLAALVEAAHERGIAVVVDAVYNHIGPEGAVHGHFGPYFTDRYRTPWGDAVNVDGPGSDAVRAYFVEHACYLVGELGVDGLRLDAVHEIVDTSASPFLAELTTTLSALGRALGRTVTVTAESPANDPRLTAAVAAGGLGCDASWDDDFHHALRSTLTGEKDRFFADFHGLADLGTASCRGWVLAGRHSQSFGRRHGAPLPPETSGDRLVVFAQNHDQIANAGRGERLASALPLAAQYPITLCTLLAPFVPLRFMGEEYGETTPFHFFTSHDDPELARAVRRGRAAELSGDTLDPQDPATFAASRPDRTRAGSAPHADLLDWQRTLLALRRSEPALGSLEPALATPAADVSTSTLALLRRAGAYLDAPAVVTICRFARQPHGGGEAAPAAVGIPLLGGRRWEVRAARGARGLAPGDVVGGPDAPAPELVLEGYAAVVAVEVREHGPRVGR